MNRIKTDIKKDFTKIPFYLFLSLLSIVLYFFFAISAIFAVES